MTSSWTRHMPERGQSSSAQQVTRQVVTEGEALQLGVRTLGLYLYFSECEFASGA